MAMARPSNPTLNSWKEIARYMGRAVRTVQRWERELKLPVHRPRRKIHSPVCAFPQELDAWLRSADPASLPLAPGTRKYPPGDPNRPSVVAGVLVQRCSDLTRRLVVNLWEQQERAKRIENTLRRNAKGTRAGQHIPSAVQKRLTRKPNGSARG
jgi:hypothetical protein